MNNKILSLYVEILSQCNEHCVYCYNKDSLKESYFLDTIAYERLLKDAQKLGIQSVTISGGEPFLHKSFNRIIEITKSLNLPLTVITNLTIYNPEIYKCLCENSVSLQVTIDGPNKHIHDYTRGNGTFERILNNIDLLDKMGYKGNLNIRMNLHKQNYMYIEDMFWLLQTIKASFINFALINPVGGGKFFENIISNTDEAILSTIQYTVDKESKRHKNIKALFEGLKESIGCPYYGRENIQCGLRISSAGNVFPCQLFTDDIFSLGNINKTSIIDIINGDSMNDFLSLIHLRRKYIPKCHNCAYKGVCFTGCPGEAYNNGGSIFSVNKKCTLNKKLFEKFFNNIIQEDNNTSNTLKQGDLNVH